MTATDNQTWTSAQWNTHVRDNLNETMPGKATAGGGQWYITTGTNAIAARTISTATVATSQATTNTGYTDLTTVGPSVTVTTGTQALVFIAAHMQNNTADQDASISYAVSGATTVAASDSWRAFVDGVAAANPERYGMVHFRTGLTAGSNTFTMKYRTGGATTATFQDRTIIVMAL
jgi:phenylacetate-coenzyme A ligase PaaK-like adenylate-forming protein